MKIDVPTVHNEARYGDIANTVILLGDPLRAKYIVDNYLENVTCYNKVRNMYGYTGFYKGVKVSVQGCGMGIPSIGIYSLELYEGYGVQNIIRVGTCGILANKDASEISNSVKIRDIVVANDVDTDSNYLNTFASEKIVPKCSDELLNSLISILNKEKIDAKIGKIFTSDVFYKDKSELLKLSKKDVIGVEMETLALYANAVKTNKNAIAMYMVSDNPVTGEFIDSKEREQGLSKVIELALKLAIECEK